MIFNFFFLDGLFGCDCRNIHAASDTRVANLMYTGIMEFGKPGSKQARALGNHSLGSIPDGKGKQAAETWERLNGFP